MKELEKIGRPGEVYPYWLGEIAYDDIAAGKALAENLLSELIPPERANIIAFSGGHDVISANRELGLSAILTDKITLHQIIKTNWDPAFAQSRVQRLLQRYPNANMLWAASDDIALASLSKLSATQAEKVVTGGIDMTSEALNSIEQGKLKVTVGGHFMQAAWAVIKIHDHNKGINRFDNTLFAHSVVTLNNVRKYKKIINEEFWRDVSFKKFSTFYSGTKAYSLNLDSFLLD